MKKIVLITLITTSILLGETPQFSNGVHLHNHDKKSYQIKLPLQFSTRICHIKKPTKKIQNGIASATAYNEKYKIIASSKSMTVILTIPPKTKVPCLCTSGCTVDIVGIGEITINDQHTAVIKDGKIKIQKNF